jgi:hypothetical protein
VRGTRAARTTTVRAMIDVPQVNPTSSWKNFRIASAASSSGCRMLASGIRMSARGIRA